MNKIIVVIVILAGSGFLAWKAYQYDQAQQKGREAERARRAETHKKFSNACLKSVERQGIRVLNWTRGSGPWKTSSGYKFSGRANIGGRKVSVECYFNASGKLIDLVASPEKSDY